MYKMNTLVAARSKACACRSSHAGIVGSNPEETRVFFFYLCFVLSCIVVCVGLITRPE